MRRFVRACAVRRNAENAERREVNPRRCRSGVSWFRMGPMMKYGGLLLGAGENWLC